MYQARVVVTNDRWKIVLMNGLEGLGIFGSLIIFFWIIAGILVPFFIWGIYNKAHKISKEVTEIRKILKDEMLEVVVVENDKGVKL